MVLVQCWWCSRGIVIGKVAVLAVPIAELDDCLSCQLGQIPGNHFIRAVMVVEPIVRKRSKVLFDEPPDPEHIAINRAMIEAFFPEVPGNKNIAKQSTRKSRTRFLQLGL